MWVPPRWRLQQYALSVLCVYVEWNVASTWSGKRHSRRRPDGQRSPVLARSSAVSGGARDAARSAKPAAARVSLSHHPVIGLAPEELQVPAFQGL